LLDSETKRRVDAARDILVGKVPDPKSQVEQITIALIYKFMDDMDAESEELGGKRKFFANDFARYGWAKLMRSGLGGHETLNLYAEAIAKMPENPGMPQLFRDIFKNAYLPYRDPETLRSFLKVIDEFNYDHSERLGDAYEYLLSVLGSQGDAGQFRTPRHIIDFIVTIIDPKKNESVLDPACGTAGFLISSYKHIIKANCDTDGNITLTPDEKGRLSQNFRGYDISPDMVRLSLVNMYLHGFAAPHIYEYDTLTSLDRWNEHADVILANPPFMSPKGGIRPHNRFSVQSKRSEVLFVAYMAEHLTPNGRAGIIVPEGIIFQSQNAYKQLRKMLVEDYLVAVISLPAGVFNPYSGVKTTILILDKSLAKKTSTIGFFKIENDGFGLGAQRREIDKNDLPGATAEIGEYLHRLRAGDLIADFQPTLGLVVGKAKVSANGDYNMSGERYRENDVRTSQFPIVPLGKVAEVISGQSPPGDSYNDAGNGTPFYQGKAEFGKIFIGNPTRWTTAPQRFAQKYDILMSVRAPVGPVNFATERICIGRGLAAIRPNEARLLTSYTFYVLRSLESEINGDTGAAFASINRGDIEKIQIPLPPLEVQKEIVSEIAAYQKVIDGARAVLDHYRPNISIHPDWPIVTFAEAPFEIIDGDRGVNYPKKEDFLQDDYCAFLNTKNVLSDGFNFDEVEFITREKDATLRKGKLRRGDVVLTTRGTIGNTGYYNNAVPFDNVRINSGMLIFRPDENKLYGDYLFHFFQSHNFAKQRVAIVSGSAQPQLPIRSLVEAKLPLPPLATQQAIVAEIEAEQALVYANSELIARFEKKIQATLARIWGEGKD
jgi:type I restriction enzyme M protein